MVVNRGKIREKTLVRRVVEQGGGQSLDFEDQKGWEARCVASGSTPRRFDRLPLYDRWRLRERSPNVGRSSSSFTAFNLDRDDPDTSRLLLLGWGLLLHALLLMHHVGMLLLLLLGRRRRLLIVVLLVDLRRRRRVGDVVVALVDEVVRVGEHRRRCCET